VEPELGVDSTVRSAVLFDTPDLTLNKQVWSFARRVQQKGDDSRRA
jgi:hypothetical protein